MASGEINGWISRIKRAEKSRDRADKRYGYTRSILQYQNDFVSAMPSFLEGLVVIPINEPYAFCKAFIPSVYSRDPYITVNPQNYQSIKGSKIMELYLNAKWRNMRLKREVKRIILDGILSEGWVKVGYSAVFGSIEPKTGKPGIESNEFIQDEEIFATRISWKDMVRDPDAIDGIHDARWVAQKIIKPLEAIRASNVYEHAKDLEPSFIVDASTEKEWVGKRAEYSGEDEIAYVALWEIWDRDSNKVLTISEGHSNYLRNEKWPYRLEGYPYILLRFNDNPDEAYAPNLIDSWTPQLWEKIKLRAMALDHVKRFNRQLSIEDGSLAPKEIQKLEMGKTASVIKRKKGSAVPEPIPYPPLQADVYAIETRIDLDKDNVSGQPNAVRSAPQRTQSRTLGEIDRLISSFQARQSEPQDIIEDFCEEIGFKILKLTEQFMTGEQYVKATKKQLAEIIDALRDPITGASRYDGRGFRFTNDDIRDIEYEIDVRSGSTLPMNKENRMEVLQGLLKLGPTLGIQPGGKVARVLGKSLLSELELKEVEQAFDEEMQQLENTQRLLRLQQEQNLTEAEQQMRHMREAGPDGMMALSGTRLERRPPRASQTESQNAV